MRDIDFRRKIVTILKTKSQKKREIPIGNGISRLLLRKRKHPDSSYVFCQEDGSRIGSFRKAFKTALKKAGIEDFTFHDLRHTFDSHMDTIWTPKEKTEDNEELPSSESLIE